MAKCKTVLTPLLLHGSYCSFAQINIWLNCSIKLALLTQVKGKELYCLYFIWLVDCDLYIDGLVQDCSNSSALAVELLQPCTKTSIYIIK